MRGLLLKGSVPAQLGVSLGLVLARSRVGSTSHEDVGREGECVECVSLRRHIWGQWSLKLAGQPGGGWAFRDREVRRNQEPH